MAWVGQRRQVEQDEGKLERAPGTVRGLVGLFDRRLERE